MIIVDKKIVNNIPVIELVKSNQIDKKIPLAIFYHGVTNQKEQGLTAGYELAQRGFRTIIPDAFLHGERKEEPYQGPKEMAFWHIELKTVEELPALVDYYVAKGLATKNQVTVTGLSMGAIATCMAFAKYPWIKAGGCLMGNPDPSSFTQWLLTSQWRSVVEGLESIDQDVVLQAMAPFNPLSLKRAPEKIAGRPFYIWHGEEDETVPFEQMKAFVESISQEPYAKNVHFEFYEGHAHKVPYEVFVKMADYLGV
ncbi:prolyl oligopeptidase family serine peptidase [Jeotgalibaca sp. A127]|uniref:prolyl oligopeptidase family serine peptidase n=1 Tax=Jeotgalibaca sp. A127 TaxID=3457324 RepID=UPI003FD1CF8E